MDETFMLEEVLGDYGLPPAVARAVKFILKDLVKEGKFREDLYFQDGDGAKGARYHPFHPATGKGE